MTATPIRRRWQGPPLAFQILGLLIGGLVVAQLVTLFLTMVLPPAPPAQYGLDDIAAVLRGEARATRRGLQRVTQAGPPDLSGPGWLVSERSRHELATLLGVRDGEVSLSFYTPLPFAGTTSPRPMAAMADDGPIARLAAASGDGGGPARFILAQAQAPPLPPPPLPAAGGLPRTDRAGGFGLPRHDGFPPGLTAGARPTEAIEGRQREPRGLPGGLDSGPAGAARGGLYAIDPRPLPGRGTYIPGDGGAAVPPLLRTPTPPGSVEPGRSEAPPAAALRQSEALTAAQRQAEGPFAPVPGEYREFGPRGLVAREETGRLLPAAPMLAPMLAPAKPAAPVIRLAPRPAPPAASAQLLTPPAVTRDAPAAVPFALPAIGRVSPEQAAPAGAVTLEIPPPAGPPIMVTPPARGLFGLVQAPFVEGDFVAALRLPDGRWSVVQPTAEPFPNAWQRRLLLWFAVAFAIVAPLGWLFARRLVKPLAGFAAAAEQLGRDPAAAILALDGPAEIGRAARAFNLMQSRLRSFVDDRTAMVGAISHDLRTPLTRLRFRIEDVPDDQRDGMLEEVAEMEAMISSVLEFIRDASTPNLRERLDLRTLLDDVAEDAVLIGSDVTVERGESATVEVDVLGMRRVLDNLLDNAVKYGARARVRLRTEPNAAVAEIFDDGPGLPEEELERVFEPFYRSEAARSSDARGSGLGLAVCRSITRAHGGDVVLLRSQEGFVAQVRVPLAYGNERPLAA